MMLKPLSNLLRTVPTKLRRQFVVSTIRVAIAAMTFMTMVLAAWYGYTTWLHRARVIQSSDLRRVIAEVRDINKMGDRWTFSSLQALEKNPLVALAYPRKLVQVQVQTAQGRSIDVSLEGVCGQETSLLSNALAGGRALVPGNYEVIVTTQLVRKINPAGPIRKITIGVTRMVDERPEQQRIEMDVVGIVERNEERVYALLETAIDMDRWQTHKATSLLGGSEQQPLPVYDYVDAYVRPDFESAVDRENTLLRTKICAEASISLPEARGYGLSVPATVMRYSLVNNGAAFDQDEANNRLTDERVSQIRRAQPTFMSVEPRIEIDFRLGQHEHKALSASGAADLIWRESPHTVGSRDIKPGQVVMAAHLLKSDLPRNALGREIKIGITGPNGKGVSIPLQVVGVTENRTSIVHTADAATWRRFQLGEMLFDQSSGRFTPASKVYDDGGFIAAVCYASSDENIEPLIRQLEAQGYEVKHQLDEQRNLSRLAVAISTLVLLFVGTSLVQVAFTSGAVSWMDVRSRLKEAGIMMAYGVSKSHIIATYLFEVTLIGMVASVVGTVVLAIVTPWLKQLLLQTLGLTNEFYIVPFFSSQTSWIFVSTLLIVITSNLVGTWLPTWLALRKRPVELMR
ncbi:MAG: FtsX-like permease family protein [Planctomycetales bacterium]|nr:FtsX-like permease family protein [Planctomycetales bacterium]